MLLSVIAVGAMAQQRKAATGKKATTTATAKKSTAKSTAKKSTAKSTAKKTATKKKAAAKPATVSSLRSEQARVKQNIKKQEQALRANKAQVQKKLKDLDRLNGDMSRRQKSIDSINHEIRRINNDIGLLSTQLDNLNHAIYGEAAWHTEPADVRVLRQELLRDVSPTAFHARICGVPAHPG